MLASDLLGAQVLDADGAEVGQVDDLRGVRDGPYIDGFGLALRVSHVVIGPGGLGVRLGYLRRGVRGPAVVRWLARRGERRCVVAEWEQVDRLDDDTGVLHLRVAGGELASLLDHV